MNENDIMNEEEQIKLPKSNINDSYKYNYNYYSPNYEKDIKPTTYELDYNNDIKQFNTSPKIYQNHSHFKKINNIIPHHYCHLSRENKHMNNIPHCRSNSSSPSPIKNISQPLYHTYYNSNLNFPYDNNNLIYNNGNSQMFFSDELSNEFSNNNNNNDIQKMNDNIELKTNKNGEINHLNAMVFDDYMSKLVYNKYNKMKQFNESYYLRKQFGDETNYTNINNTFNDDNIKEEFDTMKKNLEKKYKLYEIITKYDKVGLKNSLDENIDKKEEDENSKNNIDKEKKNKKKSKKNKRKKYHRKNISSSSEKDSDFDSSPEKNNFVKDEKNNNNVIQKTFNENIGIKNSSYVSSTFNHIKEKDIENNNKEPNINNSNLLEYLKKENEELKNTNNSYKQTLDTLFYFLNNMFHKFRKEGEENENNNLFDLSNDVNNIENLSKKLINLEALINDKEYKNIKNKIQSNSLLMMTKENSLQYPELTKLEKFNDLIEGLNEKCFSFKNEDNYIERYKNTQNENNINNIKIKEIPDINQKIDEKLYNKINTENDKDKCVACILGCNVSKRGYSPMRYNPKNKKEKRKDDSGDLFDKYNESKKLNKNKSKESKRRRISKSKSDDNSLVGSSNNSKRNSKSMKLQKKTWK